MDAERVAVIVGVGQVNDRPDVAAEGLDSAGLMVAALREAERDAGGVWLVDADRLSTVDQISCPDLGPGIADGVAASVGAVRAVRETTEMPHGDSPIRLMIEAANRIARGETRIEAITGGEALRTAAARAKAGTSGGDILRGSPKRRGNPWRSAHGLLAPVDLYPLYENATRAAWGQSFEEGQAESGALWAGLSRVAAANPHAWIREARTADEIVTPSAANRPLAFPYTKLMVANASVNQGAGFIVASLAEARRRGVPDARLVFVGRGAGAAEPYEVLERGSFARSTAVEAVLEGVVAANGGAAPEEVELYSCFPVVPKLARRILGRGVEAPISVHGGLTFGGAPVANYMSHAVAGMVERLRGTPARGLLYGNGGIVTSHHAVMLSGVAMDGAGLPHDPDVQARAEAGRAGDPGYAEGFAGPAEIESWTVFHNREGAAIRGVIAARVPSGERVLADVPVSDAAGLRVLLCEDGEVAGRRVEIRAGEVATATVARV